jgi:hypothetical protein
MFLHGGMAVIETRKTLPHKAHHCRRHTKRQYIENAGNSAKTNILQPMLKSRGSGSGQGTVTQSDLMLRNKGILLYNAIGPFAKTGNNNTHCRKSTLL